MPDYDVKALRSKAFFRGKYKLNCLKASGEGRLVESQLITNKATGRMNLRQHIPQSYSKMQGEPHSADKFRA